MLEHIIAPFDHGRAGNYCIQVLAEVVHVSVHDDCKFTCVSRYSMRVSMFACVFG